MWSNLFINTPLTAANMQAAIGRMLARSCEPISVQPDVLVVPPGLIEESIASVWRAVTRLAQKLAEPIKRGRFEQRQRRKAQGVWASCTERRARIERRIVALLLDIEMFEGMLP